MKDEALFLVRNALRQIDFMDAERMVRINQLPRGLDELECLVNANVHMILIPKCEDPQMVRDVDARISKQLGLSPFSLRKEGAVPKLPPSASGVQRPLLMPIVESCLGVFNALEIARASKNVAALTIGLEDYTADLGTQRTLEAKESFWARSRS